MKRILLFLISSISLFPAYSQTNGKLWGGLEAGYGIGLSDKGDYYNLSYGSGNIPFAEWQPISLGVNRSEMDVNIIRLVLGYYVIPQLSLGAGIGFNTNSLPGVSTLPLYIDIRYHPVADNPNLVLNVAAGYAPLISEHDTKGKFLADFSVGYKLFNLKKVSFVPFIGYNFINYSLSNPYNYPNDPIAGTFNQSRHSIFLKIGMFY
jgi:hypothetical protein